MSADLAELSRKVDKILSRMALRPCTPCTRYSCREIGLIYSVDHEEVRRACRLGQVRSEVRPGRGGRPTHRIKLEDAERWFTEVYLPAHEVKDG